MCPLGLCTDNHRDQHHRHHNRKYPAEISAQQPHFVLGPPQVRERGSALAAKNAESEEEQQHSRYLDQAASHTVHEYWHLIRGLQLDADNADDERPNGRNQDRDAERLKRYRETVHVGKTNPSPEFPQPEIKPAAHRYQHDDGEQGQYRPGRYLAGLSFNGRYHRSPVIGRQQVTKSGAKIRECAQSDHRGARYPQQALVEEAGKILCFFDQLSLIEIEFAERPQIIGVSSLEFVQQ